jgi:PAT family beta-lactamase induction signal transducer AmpG
MNKSEKFSENPWSWIPTLYFAEGIPYFLVNTISVIMFKKMGMPNGELAFATSLLYLPWVIKPLWSPFVDILKTKRWWVVTMQILMAVAFAFLAFSLPRPDAAAIASESVPVSAFVVTLVIFWITALASATHDIAADGFYMLALDSYRQSLFVGIRSTFYRISSVFGQGVLVVVAGVLETRTGDIPQSWFWTMVIAAAILGVVSLYHVFVIPKPAVDVPRKDISAGDIVKEFGRTFVTFFQKKGIWVAMLFMLLYRLPEAFLVKMINPFFLDPVSVGGLGLSTEDVGLIYGTIGVIALTIGGIIGGVFASKYGLKKSLWPMALSLALPCGVFVYLSLTQTTSILPISVCVALDQFGYGFGFTAYMLYMIYFSEGEFKTAHYSICTAFMAMSMMIPGLVAGYLQEMLGYINYFWLVMVCCFATVLVTFIIKVDPEFGKKK